MNNIMDLTDRDYQLIIDGLEAYKNKDVAGDLMIDLFDVVLSPTDKMGPLEKIKFTEERDKKRKERQEEAKKKSEIIKSEIDLIKAKVTMTREINRQQQAKRIDG